MNYYYNLIITLTLLLLSDTGWSQGRTLPENHFKYLVVKHIMERVAPTYGDPRPVPHLVMYMGHTSNRIAEFSNLAGPQIIFDERLYDLCIGLEVDSLKAIAFILGHELSHYYLKHDEWAGLAQMLMGKKVAPENIAQAQTLELLADKRGLFHSFSAGYDSFGLLGRLYDKIYQEYKLPDQIKGYYSKSTRINLAVTEETSTRRYAEIYEIGKFFYLTGKYSEASQCFGKVATQFPIKEVYNNLGISELKQAYAYIPLSEMPFALPFELENANRLSSISRSGNVQLADNHLRLARKYFEEALNQDPDYLAAYIDLGITQLLMKKFGTAIETLEDTKKRNKWSNHSQLVQAVARLYNGDYQQANQMFSQISRGYHKEYNDLVLKKFAPLINRKKALDPEEVKQLYNQFFASSSPSFKNRTTLTTVLTKPGSAKDTILLPVVTGKLMKAYINTNGETVSYRIEASGKVCYEFLVIGQHRVYLQSDPLNLEDNPSTIKSRLGSPTEQIPYDENSSYLVYKEAGLIVQIENDLIIRHLLFRDYSN